MTFLGIGIGIGYPRGSEARRNLLTFTEQFDNAAWTKDGLTVGANTSVAPNGATTAETLTENGATAVHYIRSANVPLVADLTATFSVYAKPNGRDWIRLVAASIGNAAYFNVATGTAGIADFCTSRIASAGNGWYRCEMTFTTQAGTSFDVRLASADGTENYTGNSTSGVLLWGAQMEIAAIASAYQVIGAP